MQIYRIGLDIGSTTLKAVAFDEENNIIFSKYERHNAQIRQCLLECLKQIENQTGDTNIHIRLTGSVGMGVAEKYGLPFVQEVVAVTQYITACHPSVSSMIDIGGEDAKVVLLQDDKATDLRMNGNCAGGTGAFIDQMAILLGVPIDELSELALQSGHIYPLASRCGVFCKTDIQNLIAKNVCKEDIAASIFRAVAVQTIVTLARGCTIKTPMLFVGGPLTFIPALRKAFLEYLNIHEQDIILPPKSQLIPAWGAALANSGTKAYSLKELIEQIGKHSTESDVRNSCLPPIFKDEADYSDWKLKKALNGTRRSQWKTGEQEITIGIDSGSTTTKIVALDNESRILFTYYRENKGNPVASVAAGLNDLLAESKRNGTELKITGSCTTGYGEDLIRAAFGLDNGIIETMAHYVAARHMAPEVSFILDIGGQDMKAIFVNNGIISRIEINEACSSGCGSFIGTFAKSLGYGVDKFSQEACLSSSPCDLGTRCTVFMNSRVKQVLREGASVADIAAGLSYSVVKNCLYKVLKLKDTDCLGECIVVQGGTMRNDAVVRSLELLTGRQVLRSNEPELMGAFGCALHAKHTHKEAVSLDDVLQCGHYTSAKQQCNGCENNCLVNRYKFGNGNRYFSGNRCEKVFTNKGDQLTHGINAYEYKLQLLFERSTPVTKPVLTIGIPRCLNMFEEYPFWHTLFTHCNIQVELSSASAFDRYEAGARLVMSDNICFPAKLVHSHIQELAGRNTDRIFMPFVVFGQKDGNQNSYNCPIVSGYSEVIKSVQNNIKLDSPVISFKDKALLYKQCRNYLRELGCPDKTIKSAFGKAIAEQDNYEKQITSYNLRVLADGRKNRKQAVLLAGRPYHADPLIQHKLSDMIAAMGVDVVTDDIVRDYNTDVSDTHFVSQWAYPNRILKAAKWVSEQNGPILFMQMTSFGCGPDAFLTDEVRDLLKRNGKAFTLLKIDDVNNIGSLKLRVRSTIENIRLNDSAHPDYKAEPFINTPVYGKERRRQKIIVPFFTPFFSPLMPALMKLAGYDADILPVSDTASGELGLKYANNEVCYPATLIVGDVIKAFNEKRYDPKTTAVLTTQTGGQCRASNYISLIKRALIEAGYKDVPIVSLSLGSGLSNQQPGFNIDWIKMIPIILAAILYGDCIAKFYYAAVIREKEKGKAAALRDKYLDAAKGFIESNRLDSLIDYLQVAAKDFDNCCADKECPKVGIVGEIFLKFNPFAQKNITNWLIEQEVEIVPPLLADFFLQIFVNIKVDKENNLRRNFIPDFVFNWLYSKVEKQVRQVNDAGKAFRYFVPFHDIWEKSRQAEKVISLQAQFGEGWLLPAEVISCRQQGVTHILSLQPFGCIANHIVSKGIENRLKRLYPDLNLLSLDFDNGVSEVNILNRMLLFTDSLRR